VATAVAAAGGAPPETLDTLARVGTALSDPTRRRILVTLLEGAAHPAELADALATGRTNVSNHLACLRGCGLVRGERQGRQVRYELASPRLAHALSDLIDLELSIERDHEHQEPAVEPRHRHRELAIERGHPHQEEHRG
jgi:ArsR family transcriptional regulator, cadmium/lead-responsive transcriptional repressor